jgi:hypothetical protein
MCGVFGSAFTNTKTIKMNIEQQVCSLEQAKRLKELGVNALAYFAWTEYENAYGNKSFSIADTRTNCMGRTNQDGRTNYRAYTVAELMGIIPYSKGEDSLLCVMPPNEGNEYLWTCLYLPIGTAITDYVEDDYSDGNTLAECLAAFLIYLIENNIFTPKQINDNSLL